MGYSDWRESDQSHHSTIYYGCITYAPNNTVVFIGRSYNISAIETHCLQISSFLKWMESASRAAYWFGYGAVGIKWPEWTHVKSIYLYDKVIQWIMRCKCNIGEEWYAKFSISMSTFFCIHRGEQLYQNGGSVSIVRDDSHSGESVCHWAGLTCVQKASFHSIALWDTYHINHEVILWRLDQWTHT